MQTIRQLRNGVQYVKTTTDFATMHSFMVPVARASVLKGHVCQWGSRAVKSIAIISRAGFEANRRAGYIFSTGNGSLIYWRP